MLRYNLKVLYRENCFFPRLDSHNWRLSGDVQKGRYIWMLQKSLNHCSFSFLLCCLCETALKTRLDISFPYLFKQLFYRQQTETVTELVAVLFCLDVPRRPNALAVDARLLARLLRHQRHIQQWKLLLSQTHCWNLNVSATLYRAFSGIFGTV